MRGTSGPFQVEKLAGRLEKPPQFRHPIIDKAARIAGNVLQVMLDVLSDAMGRWTKGDSTGLANCALFSWIIDELLVARHLAQRGFINQAFSHIRTALELLNLIELFHIDPSSAQRWAATNSLAKKNEFKPSKVRVRLGRQRDPLYAMLSGAGIHGSITGFAARVKQQGTSLAICVGGAPLEHSLALAAVSLVCACVAALRGAALLAGEGYLLKKQALERFIPPLAEIQSVLEADFVPWCEKQNIDVQSLKEYSNNILEGLAQPPAKGSLR